MPGQRERLPCRRPRGRESQGLLSKLRGEQNRGQGGRGPALRQDTHADSGLRPRNCGPQSSLPGPGTSGAAAAAAIPAGPVPRAGSAPQAPPLPSPPRAPANGHLLAVRARRPARPPLPATCHAPAGRIAPAPRRRFRARALRLRSQATRSWLATPTPSRSGALNGSLTAGGPQERPPTRRPGGRRLAGVSGRKETLGRGRLGLRPSLLAGRGRRSGGAGKRRHGGTRQGCVSPGLKRANAVNP